MQSIFLHWHSINGNLCYRAFWPYTYLAQSEIPPSTICLKQPRGYGQSTFIGLTNSLYMRSPARNVPISAPRKEPRNIKKYLRLRLVSSRALSLPLSQLQSPESLDFFKIIDIAPFFIRYYLLQVFWCLYICPWSCERIRSFSIRSTYASRWCQASELESLYQSGPDKNMVNSTLIGELTPPYISRIWYVIALPSFSCSLVVGPFE